jgi:hypothetical protein
MCTIVFVYPASPLQISRFDTLHQLSRLKADDFAVFDVGVCRTELGAHLA